MCAQRLQLRAEQEDLAAPAVIKRLFADAVAAQVKHMLVAVPQCKREHAIEFLHGWGNAPSFEGCEHYFCIGMAAEIRRAWAGNELRLQPFGVVDLAVVGDDVAS